MTFLSPAFPDNRRSLGKCFILSDRLRVPLHRHPSIVLMWGSSMRRIIALKKKPLKGKRKKKLTEPLVEAQEEDS